MESLRELKITIYIDTNKATYTESFGSMEDAIEYYNAYIQEFNPTIEIVSEHEEE